MADLTECTKCGSKSIIPDVRVADRTRHGFDWNDLQVTLDGNSIGLFKGRVRVSVRAAVCGSCGFMEFYATDPSLLLRAHSEAKDRSKYE